MKFSSIKSNMISRPAFYLMVLIVLLAGVFYIAQAGSSDAGKGSVLKSEDNRSQVLLPASWKPDRSLNKDADLIAASDQGGLVMAIHAEHSGSGLFS